MIDLTKSKTKRKLIKSEKNKTYKKNRKINKLAKKKIRIARVKEEFENKKCTFKILKKGGAAEERSQTCIKITNCNQRRPECKVYQHSDKSISCVSEKNIKYFEKDNSFSVNNQQYAIIDTVIFNDPANTSSETSRENNWADASAVETISNSDGEPEVINPQTNLEEYKEFITTWFKIQNTILYDWTKGKTFLVPEEEGSQCLLINLTKEPVDNSCNDPTLFYQKREKDSVDKNIFCNLITEINKNLYVLFSSSYIIDRNTLCGKDINGYLQILIKKIFEYSTKNQEKKIILCGHSMGCVLAQRLGFLIFERYRPFFTNNIIVIGSGSFRWLTLSEKERYKDKKNIFIFFNSTFTRNETHMLDSVFDEPTSDDSFIYEPYWIIRSGTKKDPDSFKVHSTSVSEDKIDTMEYLKSLHDWNRYYEILTKLFPS